MLKYNILILLIKSVINNCILTARLCLTFLAARLHKKKYLPLPEDIACISAHSFTNYNATKLEQLLNKCNVEIISLGLVEKKSKKRYFVIKDNRQKIADFIKKNRHSQVKVQFHFKETLYNKHIIDTKSAWYYLPEIVPFELSKAINSCAMISFYFCELERNGSVIFGPAYAAQLEIWSKQDSYSDYRRCFDNDISVRISNQDYQYLINKPVRAENNIISFAGQDEDETKTSANIFDISKPIDIVYTWVNDKDTNWKEEKNNYLKDTSGDNTAVSDSRFTNRDELKYSLRSVEMFTNFVNHIYIVTADQVPEWLDLKHPKITIVSHKDIMDKAYLPTFNSHAIEANLHKIKGLSEQYIYMNDDVFFGKQVIPEMFFTSSGKSKMFLSEHTYIPLQYKDKPLLPIDNSAIKIKKLLEEKYHVNINKKFHHAPFPVVKSVMKKMSDEYQQVFTQTSQARFRGEKDLSTCSFMYHYYAYIKGFAVEGDLQCQYFDINKIEHLRYLSKYLKFSEQERKDIFCVNETHLEHSDNVDKKVNKFLVAYFPLKSSFEK